MTRKIDAAVGSKTSHCDHPLGHASVGSPLGTLPRIDTPSADRSSAYDAQIAPTTAISAPGIRGLMRLQTTITTMTDRDTTTVAPLASPICPSVPKNFCTVPPLEPPG